MINIFVHKTKQKNSFIISPIIIRFQLENVAKFKIVFILVLMQQSKDTTGALADGITENSEDSVIREVDVYMNDNDLNM